MDGVYLSQGKVSVSERITLERIDDYKSKASVVIDVDESNEKNIIIPSSDPARQILNDFLTIYSIVTGLQTKIVEEQGGSQISGVKGFGASVSPVVTIRYLPKMPEEDALKMLEQARENFQISLDAEKSLRLALRYYHHAMQTEQIEDKIILYFIGLEALYMKERLELRYWLSQRVALMLGRSENEREEIFSNLKALYGKRSKVVHGSATSLSSEEIDTLKEYLRKSVMFFLRLKRSGIGKNNIIKLLDKSWQSGKCLDELFQQRD